jgi:hypothetical protein
MNRKIYANPTFGGYMRLSEKRIFRDASEIWLLRVVENTGESVRQVPCFKSLAAPE